MEENSVSRKLVCEVAMSYLGTPFHHQGRFKGVGLDCAGLIVGISQECKLYKDKVEDIKGYSRIPDGKTLRDVLLKGTKGEKPISELKEGDIILMRFHREPQHLGLYMPNNQMIHSYEGIGKVVIHDFDEKWKNRVISIFEFHNIEA
jgi:cell wall-associated NlpC family hydrolase